MIVFIVFLIGTISLIVSKDQGGTPVEPRLTGVHFNA